MPWCSSREEGEEGRYTHGRRREEGRYTHGRREERGRYTTRRVVVPAQCPGSTPHLTALRVHLIPLAAAVNLMLPLVAGLREETRPWALL